MYILRLCNILGKKERHVLQNGNINSYVCIHAFNVFNDSYVEMSTLQKGKNYLKLGMNEKPFAKIFHSYEIGIHVYESAILALMSVSRELTQS